MYEKQMFWQNKNVINNGEAKLVERQIDISSSETPIFAYLKDLTLNITLEKDVYDYTCPSDKNKNCYKDANNYFCSLSECSSGSGIQLETNDPNMSPDDLVDTSKKENHVCSVDGITIAEGTFGSCRLSSNSNLLADNCCDMTIDNRDAQNAIVTGVADVISVLGGTYTLISDLFKAIGIADFDFIGQVLKDMIEWITGGSCTDSEIMIATSAASTRGLVVKDSGSDIVYKDANDGGNCVYLGDYCTNYLGWCDKGSFLGIKWENPMGLWGCERPAKAFCCYSDIFEKALAKAARDQMPNKYNWGSINGDVVSPTRLYSPGKNPCKPDKDKLNVNCAGVTISDLVNINLDSKQFQEDMKTYTAIMLNDMTKSGGAIDMANEEMKKNISNLKPADILQDTLNSIGAIK